MRSALGPRGALLLALGALATPGQAHAAGALACTAGDKALAFTARGVVEPGAPARVTGVVADLALAGKDLPADLARTRLTGADLSDVWLLDRSVRLRLYREREGDGPFGAIDVVVRTTAAPGRAGRFAGTYRVTLSEGPGPEGGEGLTRVVEGPVRCTIQPAR